MGKKLLKTMYKQLLEEGVLSEKVESILSKKRSRSRSRSRQRSRSRPRSSSRDRDHRDSGRTGNRGYDDNRRHRNQPDHRDPEPTTRRKITNKGSRSRSPPSSSSGGRDPPFIPRLLEQPYSRPKSDDNESQARNNKKQKKA